MILKLDEETLLDKNIMQKICQKYDLSIPNFLEIYQPGDISYILKQQ